MIITYSLLLPFVYVCACVSDWAYLHLSSLTSMVRTKSRTMWFYNGTKCDSSRVRKISIFFFVALDRETHSMLFRCVFFVINVSTFTCHHTHLWPVLRGTRTIRHFVHSGILIMRHAITELRGRSLIALNAIRWLSTSTTERRIITTNSLEHTLIERVV